MLTNLPRSLRFALILATVALVVACTSGRMQRDLIQATADVEDLYRRTETIEKSLAAINARQSASQAALKSTANLEQDLQALREEVGRVRTQVEEMQFRARAEAPKEQMSIQVRTGATTQGATITVAGDQLILDGQRAMNQGDFVSARNAFLSYLKQFPSSERAFDAYVYLGDTYYRASDWANALAAYQIASTRFPRHPRAPEALMKVALSEENLGRKDEAVAVIQRLIETYPNWEQIPQAREMLNRLRGPIGAGRP
jgi:tol-pal system protein YbgF